MKKSQFKQIVKECVKECIHECLLESGLISNIIFEVLKGTNKNLVLKENKELLQEEKKQIKVTNNKLKEVKKNLLDSIGANAYNGVDIFKGTEPITPERNLNSMSNLANPLRDKDPKDAGVDISGLMGLNSVWKTLAEAKRKG